MLAIALKNIAQIKVNKAATPNPNANLPQFLDAELKERQQIIERMAPALIDDKKN